jgi:hypothetical protein
MAIFSLTYVSVATRSYSLEKLRSLADISARNNVKLGITGILLYNGTDFMQLLEGEEPLVRVLYSLIESDKRHHDLVILQQDHINQRLFASWAMHLEWIPKEGSPAFESTVLYQSSIGDPLPAWRPGVRSTAGHGGSPDRAGPSC